MYQKYVKRITDILLSLIGLLILLPLFAFLSLLLAISNKGEPFFFQIRPGKNEKLFQVLKFKTMSDKMDEKGNMLPDSMRLTMVGKIIRKTSLDEIPQLINVLKGDMSLIGPRPLLVEYLQFYNDYQKRRHEVRPGITGWAQVNGRNAISWEKKFEFDVFYVDNCSFLLDLKIFYLTILKVLKREGINQDDNTSMQMFKGTKS